MATSSSQKLDLTIISARDLNVVSLISKMDVYAEATLSSYPRTKQRTRTDENGHKDPSWNAQFQFSIPTNVDHSTLSIAIVLRAEKTLGDRDIGEVHIPIADLESDPKSFDSTQFVSYQVTKPGGKPKGILNISYRFGERHPPPEKSDPPTAYPAAQTTSATPPYLAQPYPPPETAPTYPPPGYPPPMQGHDNHPPHSSGYNYQVYPPPPPAGYPQPSAAGYPQPSAAGYHQPSAAGYPQPSVAGYPYGSPPPMMQPSQKPPKKNKFGLGLGAGLLGGAIGGMLIGDAIGDAVDDAAAYDAGYDAGFDDAAGFDGGFDGGFDF